MSGDLCSSKTTFGQLDTLFSFLFCSLDNNYNTITYCCTLLGQSVRSGQFDSSGSELSFNISDIQEQGDVMAFLMDENITIIDNVANISSQMICFNDTVRDALAMVASVDIACGECG